MTPKEIFQTIKDKDVKFVDLRFTDTRGKEQHVSVPVKAFGPDKFESGHFFDGSSIAGWKGIQASDMVLLPDPTSSFIDPFLDQTTLAITCDVIEPSDSKGYDRDPRSIAKRGEAYLKSTGLGDTAFFGPEPEFFIFDAVEWSVDMSGARLQDLSPKKPHGPPAKRSTTATRATGRPLRAATSLFRRWIRCRTSVPQSARRWKQMGVVVEVHHHEVATAGQNEIGTKFAPLVQRADWMMRLKYAVHNVAAKYGKTATFMPKPIVGDNGSGMHVHQSIWKGEQNLFAGDGYAGLSEFAIYYIGGIIKHAKALNAITNPGTNSYKRLVPGFEAPINLAYSARNRSAAVRVPLVTSAKARRIEVRFPDPTANPYLAFTAMMMAGLDGVQNKIQSRRSDGQEPVRPRTRRSEGRSASLRIAG